MFQHAALMALFFLLPAKEPQWFQISSDHFLLFTDTSEAKGQRLVSDLETRVATFGEAFGKVPARQFPIEVFLFDQEKDFIEALPHVQGPEAEKQLNRNAYLLKGPDRAFIIAKDKSPDAIANDVAHPLGHLLFERSVIWRPFWLAEGAADYVRMIGRPPNTKPITEQDGFSVSDMFTIVASATYDDNDPPTVFRAEAYRLVRFLLDQKPDALRQYVASLRTASDKMPKVSIDGSALQEQFNGYSETAMNRAPAPAAVKSAAADPGVLAIHRGDVLLATDRQSDAAQWYNADSPQARAARAILTRFSRPQAEAIRALERTAREMPDNGLVQYHFGAMETSDVKDIGLQKAALERAVQLLPLMGRAYAELARVDALSGEAEKSLPLIEKALALEPEFADRFYEIRAEADLALDHAADASRDIEIASELPHAGRSAVEHYSLSVADIQKRIVAARRKADLRDLEQLRNEVRTEVERREPPPMPEPPPPPVPAGNITYEIAARAPVEVVAAEFPDYPEALRRNGVAGDITLQVSIGADGKVKSASIVSSRVQNLNQAAIEAVRKWSFKPGNQSIRLVLKFGLQ